MQITTEVTELVSCHQYGNNGVNTTETKPETILARERRLKGLTVRELGKTLGVSAQAAARYCLPPDHDDHRRPNKEASRRLREWSDGRITVDNFDEPAATPKKRRRA